MTSVCSGLQATLPLALWVYISSSWNLIHYFFFLSSWRGWLETRLTTDTLMYRKTASGVVTEGRQTLEDLSCVENIESSVLSESWGPAGSCRHQVTGCCTNSGHRHPAYCCCHLLTIYWVTTISSLCCASPDVPRGRQQREQSVCPVQTIGYCGWKKDRKKQKKTSSVLPLWGAGNNQLWGVLYSPHINTGVTVNWYFG